jgi:hypothetical protein
MLISELLSEQNLTIQQQIAKDTAAIAGMKPQEFAPGEIKPSQIYSHPKWRETATAMHKKYPNNNEQAQLAAVEAIKLLIRQGQ